MPRKIQPIWTAEGQAQRAARRQRQTEQPARASEPDNYPLHYDSLIENDSPLEKKFK